MARYQLTFTHPTICKTLRHGKKYWLAAVVVLLSACGQTGALYLPEEANDQQGPAAESQTGTNSTDSSEPNDTDATAP